MKKFKILCIAAAALFLSTTQCLAATVDVPSVDPVNSTVTLSGTVDEAGENIVITVLNPGAKIEDFVPDEKDNSIDVKGLQHLKVITSEEGGRFNYTFKLNAENTSGTFKVYINSKDNENQVITLDTDFFFASKEMQENKVAELLEPKKESETELPEKAIERILSKVDTADIFGLNSFEPFANQEKTEIAKMLYAATKDMKEEDKKSFTVAQMKQLISECAVLCAYNAGKTELVISAEGEFLHDDIIKFSNLDTTLDMTLADVYKNTVSENGQKLIRAALMNKNYASIVDLQKEFAVQICLIGLTNSANKGFGHVYTILTEKNAKVVGLTLSKTLTDDDAIAISSAGGYSTVKALQDKIDPSEDSGDGSNNYNSSSSAHRNNSGSTYSIGNPPSGFLNNEEKKENERSFTDLTNYSWAEEAIYNLFDREIINGVNSTSFAPAGLLTREQAVKMICLAVGITKAEGNGGFSDVIDGSWFAGFVAAAKEAGIASGISATEFGVGKNIKRQDFAVMICNAFGLKSETATVNFADNNNIADYAETAVATLCEKGIITGYGDNTFRPNANCTRAEAAVIIYRAIKNAGR